MNQELARELNRRGVRTLDQLVSSFDESSLAALPCGPVGRRTIGSRAGRVLRSARAMSTGREEVVGSVDLPAPEDCVLFDLEGLPAYAEDNEKVYLWGMKTVTGEGAQFRPVLAGFGLDGDRKAWEEFLSVAGGLLADRPSRRFVHWGSYEKARLTAYVERYEDRDGKAASILASLFDLHQALRRAVVLPLPSYGLKVIEKHVGFTRRLPEGRGVWAMARYIEAVEAPEGPSGTRRGSAARGGPASDARSVIARISVDGGPAELLVRRGPCPRQTRARSLARPVTPVR